jgi:hypothetical protein
MCGASRTYRDFNNRRRFNRPALSQKARKDGAPGLSPFNVLSPLFPCLILGVHSTFSGCLFRLDLHSTFAAGCGVAKTAPLPVLGRFAQCGLHRIAMKVGQLLHKLIVVPKVEIVVAVLPEMLGVTKQAPRYSLLQRLERVGQRVDSPKT